MPLVIGAGWEEGCVEERGCPYISVARAKMLRKALDAQADVIVFLDYDLSWDAGDLLKLIEAPGEVAAGFYRYKKDEEEYMGVVYTDAQGHPRVREDGCIEAERIPAGFMKITKEGVNRFMTTYPELCFGPKYNLSVDLFNHGAHDGIWYGEDYAFSRRWVGAFGPIPIIPDLNLTHHGDKPYPGNFHRFMLAQPGGSEA